MTTPSPNWPKTFLLEIYKMAVDFGYIYIQPISKADAQSLKMRLYRARRRSDSSTASFILPEYHLVTVGEWEDVGDGRLPVIYNRLPSEQPLPSIVPADGEAFTNPPSPQLHEFGPKPIPSFTEEDLTLKPEDIASFIGKMRKDVEGR